jgi:hypothetical protein
MRQRITAAAAVAVALAIGVPEAAFGQQVSTTDRFEALIGLARVKRDAGDPAEARRYFEEADRVRELTPSERAEYFWVVAGRDARAALEAAARVLTHLPQDGEIRDRAITEALSLGDESTIVTLASEGARQQPRTARWSRRIAESHLRRGEAAAAAEAYARAGVAPDATDEDRVGLAIALEASRQYGRAAEAWKAIPPAIVSRQLDWQQSRLRSLALGRPSADTAAELEQWLDAHPADADMRRMAAQVWITLREPARAVALLAAGVGSAASTDADWLRQAALLARSAELRDQARALADRLASTSGASPADRLVLADILIDTGEYSPASEALHRLPAAVRCTEPALAIADRVPAEPGLRLLSELLLDSGCSAPVKWLARAIERATAESRFDAALALIARLPVAERTRAENLCLEGQLQLWSGRPADAIPVLEAALRSDAASPAARGALADAYRSVGRYADAWQATQPRVGDSPLTVGRRLAVAEMAIEAERPDAVADLVADLSDLPVSLQAKRRELVTRAADLLARRYAAEAVAGGASAARDTRSALARLDATRARTADAELAAVLARTGGAPRAREALDLARRLPADAFNADWFADLAAALAAGGDPDAASEAADLAIARDSSHAAAWFLLFDLVTDRDLAAVHRLLDRARSTTGGDSLITVVMAERMSGLVARYGGDTVDFGLSWIDSLAATGQLRARLLVARARLLATVKRWRDALATLERASQEAAAYAPALKLRAEVLSWSGGHEHALEAYDAYLALAPDDFDARRQQARVAGWAGWTHRSLALYAALAASRPDSAPLAAEHAAKKAFFEGRWNAAAAAYERWIGLEPDNAEARFEHAQALRAAGLVAAADESLDELSRARLHSLASDAQDRVRETRQPRAAFLFESGSADGYEGQRLLERQLEGALLRAVFGSSGAFRLEGSAGRARLSGSGGSRAGYRAGARSVGVLTRSLGFTASLDVWDVWSNAAPSAEAGARLEWHPVDRWTLTAGFERSLVFENLAVVDAQIAAAGAATSVRFDSPETSFTLDATLQRLSDSNGRRRISSSLTRALPERVRNLRAIVWAELLSFADSSAVYYSPALQVRVDAGLQYTHELRVARFRGDRTSAISGAYLIGTDRTGAIYHHPSLQVSLELANGLAVDARADWVSSPVYAGRSFVISVSRRLGRKF